MRMRSLIVELALLPAVCVTAILPGTAGAQSFAVRDVRVFDGERLHPRLTVVVRDGAIESTRPDTVVPAGFEVIDGQGLTLLPGLVDSHMHAREDALVQTLVFGVTTVLDMFTDPAWAAARRAEQREGRAGVPICCRPVS
jgi:predicted amidohydrolase YtcJ